MATPIFLGINPDTGGAVGMTAEERSTHMQVIGSTGTGKSKFLEYLIREDIKAGEGLCLIDPHGYLYRDILKWAQAIRWSTERLVLFNPAQDSVVTGFNPLAVRTKELSYQVDAMVRACAKVWGGEDSDKTPLLKRCLRICFHALAEAGLTLLEGQYLTSPTKKEARRFLTRNLEDPIIQEQWEYFNSEKITPKQFYDEFGSTINRLMEFLAAERIRNIIGQREKALDLRKIMDEGKTLLVNLSGGRKLSHDNARLLGTLIVNELFLTATERPPGSRPFYLYIDECGLFINEDVARILDEGRKFGLHLILAHQHLAQLKRAGEEIYHSVMTDAKTKVVFGGLSPEDAKIMAELMFLGEIDLDEIRHSLDRPTVVGYTTSWVRNMAQGGAVGRGEGKTHSRSTSATHSQSISETSTDSWSVTEGESRQWGTSEAEGRTRGESKGKSTAHTFAYSNDGNWLELNVTDAIATGEIKLENASETSLRGYSWSEGESFSRMRGRSYSRGESQSIAETEGETEGWSEERNWSSNWQQGLAETLRPVLESRPSAVYSLQEQIWKAMDVLVNQRPREAVIKLPGKFTKRIIVPLVKELPTSSEKAAEYYEGLCHRDCCYTQPNEEAKKAIRQRRRLLLEQIKQYQEEKAAADEPKNYRQKRTNNP